MRHGTTPPPTTSTQQQWFQHHHHHHRPFPPQLHHLGSPNRFGVSRHVAPFPLTRSLHSMHPVPLRSHPLHRPRSQYPHFPSKFSFFPSGYKRFPSHTISFLWFQVKRLKTKSPVTKTTSTWRITATTATRILSGVGRTGRR